MTSISQRDDHALVLISFPHQLLHALSALQYDRQLRGISEHAPASILLWSYQADNHARGAGCRRLLEAAISRFPHVKLVLPTIRQRRLQLSPYRMLKSRADWIGRAFAGDQVEAVYFSHDASADRTAQAVMQAFPAAKRICYGDPPGFLYPSYSANLRDRKADSWFKRLFWRSRLYGLEVLYEQHVSIVAIDFRQGAMDQMSSLAGTLEVLPQSILMSNLFRIETGLRCMLDKTYAVFLKEMVKDKRPFLLLLGSFSESDLMTRNNELQMYVDICNECVPKNGRVLIKPHFGIRSDFALQLMERLSGFQVELLPEVAQQLPIELMPQLVSGCRVLSVSSSSALLSLLFGTEVIHVLNTELIRFYFKASFVDYMIDANNRIRMSMNAGGQGCMPI